MKTEPTAQPKLYIGIDIHKKSWKVHCATELFIGKSFSMPPEPKVLYDYVEKNFSGHEVSTAYEAGCCGFSAHRSFVGYGWLSVVANPADIHRRGKEKYSKTDRIDAQLIARELKDKRLNSITVPEIEREELRSLFRRRNDIVKDIRRNKSRIKMQLLYFGITIPEKFNTANSRGTSITKRANKIMRSYFVEASWQAIRADPVMQSYYRKHIHKDSKTTIIKIARKLASRTLAVIKTGIPYQPGVLQ